MRTKRSHFNIAIEHSKKKNAPTVVFLHDIGFDKRMWVPIMTSVGKQYSVLSYDIRGFGENSNADTSIATIDAHADDLHSVLEKLHIKKFVLVGNNLASHIILRFVEQYQAGCMGMCIGGFLPFGPNAQETKNITDYSHLLLDKGVKIFVKDIIKAINVDKDNTAQLKEILASNNTNAIVAGYVSLLTRTTNQRILQDFSGSILIVCGGNLSEQEYHKYLTISIGVDNAHCIRIPECRLIPALENPSAYAQVIEHFLSNINVVSE